MSTTLGDSNEDAILVTGSPIGDLVPAIQEAERLIARAEVLLERAHALLTTADAELDQLVPAPPMRGVGH